LNPRVLLCFSFKIYPNSWVSHSLLIKCLSLSFWCLLFSYKARLTPLFVYSLILIICIILAVLILFPMHHTYIYIMFSADNYATAYISSSIHSMNITVMFINTVFDISRNRQQEYSFIVLSSWTLLLYFLPVYLLIFVVEKVKKY